MMKRHWTVKTVPEEYRNHPPFAVVCEGVPVYGSDRFHTKGAARQEARDRNLRHPLHFLNARHLHTVDGHEGSRLEVWQVTHGEIRGEVIFQEWLDHSGKMFLDEGARKVFAARSNGELG